MKANNFIKLCAFIAFSSSVFTLKSQNDATVKTCGDTNYFIRKKFVYCDSLQPKGCKYRKGVFYEINKINKNTELMLESCKTTWSDAKYFIFKTRTGKVIEEGQYSGIWEMTFCHGEYKAYYPNGKLRILGHYNNGFKQGSWKYYDLNSKLIREEWYEKSILKQDK
jgi:MORN repeat variant